jgi:hypothetical protein
VGRPVTNEITWLRFERESPLRQKGGCAMTEDAGEVREDIDWLRVRVSELEGRVADLAALTETTPIIYRCLRTLGREVGVEEGETSSQWARDLNRLDELAHLLIG